MLNESMLTNNFDTFCTVLISCELRKVKKHSCVRNSSFLTLLIAACDANPPAVCYSDETTV